MSVPNWASGSRAYRRSIRCTRIESDPYSSWNVGSLAQPRKRWPSAVSAAAQIVGSSALVPGSGYERSGSHRVGRRQSKRPVKYWLAPVTTMSRASGSSGTGDAITSGPRTPVSRVYSVATARRVPQPSAAIAPA